MRKDITVVAEPRSTRGKNEARRLRVSGRIPAVVYGAAKDPVNVAGFVASNYLRGETNLVSWSELGNLEKT